MSPLVFFLCLTQRSGIDRHYWPCLYAVCIIIILMCGSCKEIHEALTVQFLSPSKVVESCLSVLVIFEFFSLVGTQCVPVCSMKVVIGKGATF